MDRTWYIRFTIVLAAFVASWLALWPSLDQWVASPDWVDKTFAGRISPGLDIQGGLRLMYEVEVDEAIKDRRDREADRLLKRLGEVFGVVDEGDWDEVTREQIEEIREHVRVMRVGEQRIRLEFADASKVERLRRDWLREHLPDLREVEREGASVTLAILEERLEELRDGAVDQAVKTINNRVDEMQVREMTVIGRGSDIIVEIPGADQEAFDRIRAVISRTARLEFRIVDDETDFLSGGELPEGTELESEPGYAGESAPRPRTEFLIAWGDRGRRALQRHVESLEAPEGRYVLIGHAAPSPRGRVAHVAPLRHDGGHR
jgi:preprotein translocase subunit SecD